MSTLKRFFQDTLIYGFATVFPRLMNFVLVPLHTDVLPAEEYSVNTVFYVWAAFFNVLLTYGMETSFFRFFSRAKERSTVFSTAFIALTITTVLFAAGVFIFEDDLIALMDLDPFYFRLLFSVLVLDTLVVVPFAYLRATGRPLKFAGIKVLNILTVVILNLYFLWFVRDYPQFAPQWVLDNYGPKDIVGYIFIANLAASAVTFLLLLPYFFRTKISFDTAVFKQMWKYGWPIMVAGIAFVINENLDKLLIKDMISDEIMGAYSGCYKLAVFMTIFVQAFKMGAEPFFFNHADKENAKETYADILKYFVISGSLIFLILVCFIDFFKALVIRDPEYWMAISIVPIILLANLFLGIYHNLSVWYKLTDRTRTGMYISILGAIITIVLNLALIPVLGFIAAAWATLFAYGAMMFVSYFLGRKYYPVPYEIKKITGYISLSVLIGAISFYVFPGNYLVGIPLLLLFIGIVYFSEKDQILKIIQS
ncbi:oligosaccharide flippase family protein [Christiangramia echinicola]|uniref:Membrane protein involved in the export of O-antigen and teichoic acid n=1 Tax=Christiangramia echinicola TaxID=279359 RepID=A0A1H1N2S2_9FLAO|nr:oligosaccharide flippase family protein [Christiangramia echinicola]SDR93262.1 Membrane protein involved in the export of O-antigen and teichoic acid [Christiangramia echinicola]